MFQWTKHAPKLAFTLLDEHAMIQNSKEDGYS